MWTAALIYVVSSRYLLPLLTAIAQQILQDMTGDTNPKLALVPAVTTTNISIPVAEVNTAAKSTVKPRSTCKRAANLSKAR